MTRPFAPIPPVPPVNPSGTSPRAPFDCTLINSGTNTVTNLRYLRLRDGVPDPAGIPQVNVRTAPALVDTFSTDTTQDNITYSNTPPEQGKTNVVIDFSKGLTPASLDNYQKGYYTWAENIWTVDGAGLAVRAPELFDVELDAGVTPLPRWIAAITTHNASSWFAAGRYVYYLEEVASALVIKEPVSQPASSANITDIISWQGILFVAHDNAAPYEWSDNDGGTWNVADGSSAPGAITTSAVSGGSLIDGTTYNIRISSVDAFGNESGARGGNPVTATSSNKTVRAAFSAVTGADYYRVYMSTGASPKFVGTVTAAQLASGIVINGQNTVTAGGTAGAIDVSVAGLGVEATTTTTQIYGKFFADYQEAQKGNNPARPILVMSADPNFVYSTEVPNDASQWNSGSIVGQGGGYNPDHNTCLVVSPTGELLVGKELNLFELDEAVDGTVQAGASVSGNVALRLGPIIADLENGQENFAWPAWVKDTLFLVTKEFDIVAWQGGVNPSIQPGNFGPAAMLPAIPEVQKQIKSLASDKLRTLFCSLAGDEGYVLAGLFNPEWQWHGAIAQTGFPIRRMWTESFPLSGDLRDLHLFIGSDERVGEPYVLKGMRLPRTNIFYDEGVTFAPEGFIRMGKDYGGQAQVQKVLSRATPNTRNLNNPSPTLEIQFRVSPGATFSPLATFNHSPLPEAEDMGDTYLPLGWHGVFVELQAILDGDTSQAAALESIEYLVFRRPIRKEIITCTVIADNSGQTAEGGRRGTSWAQLIDEIRACRDSVEPPLLIDNLTGQRWTVDLEFSPRWLLPNDGSGAVQVVDLICQELDTSAAPATGVSAGNLFHFHALETFEAPGASVTLVSAPLLMPLVFADREALIEDVDFTWEPSSRTINFTPSQSDTIRVFYVRQP